MRGRRVARWMLVGAMICLAAGVARGAWATPAPRRIARLGGARPITWRPMATMTPRQRRPALADDPTRRRDDDGGRYGLYPPGTIASR
jgi:hypothetical protein